MDYSFWYGLFRMSIVVVVLGIVFMLVVADYYYLPMKPGYRMLRLGIGRNGYRWFFRIDLWFFGIRISER